jgi:hypothetical protein
VAGLRRRSSGWRVIYGEADRAACVNYIEQHWTDNTAEESARKVGVGPGFWCLTGFVWKGSDEA